MNQLITQNSKQVCITSRDVAEWTGKEHSKVIRSIENYIDILGKAKIGSTSYFIESTYLDKSNRESKQYLLTKMGCEMVANKMTGETGIIFTAKYVAKFNEMQSNIKTDSYMIDDPIERAKRWIEEQEEKKLLEVKNKEQAQEITFKQDVIDGLSKDIKTADLRQRISQIVRHSHTNYQERYNLLYDEFCKKYHMNVDVRLSNAKQRGEIKRTANKMDYICGVLHMTKELYNLACKLFVADYSELLREWQCVIN